MSAFWPVPGAELGRGDAGRHRPMIGSGARRVAPVRSCPAQPAQATRHTRHKAAGSLSGSPWTRKKSAGPPSWIVPASSSPSSSPPRQVAAASASHGSRPASTSDSTSQASWLARSEPPPKSVPAAILTPAARASRDALHRAFAAGPRSPAGHPPRRSGAGSSSARTSATIASRPGSRPGTSRARPCPRPRPHPARTRARSRRRRRGRLRGRPDRRPAWAVTRASRSWAASTTRAISAAVQGDVDASGPSR